MIWQVVMILRNQDGGGEVILLSLPFHQKHMDMPMSVKFFTSNPAGLLADFKKRINQKEAEGSITTWEIIASGAFTHKGKQYSRDAFFRAEAKPDQGLLLFKMIRPEGKNITSRAYAYYHGHLIETFLNHFDSQFSSAAASAYPADGDIVSAPKT